MIVNMWDIRNGKVSGSFYGPKICGDAIDINENNRTLITGGYNVGDGLQLWDIRTMKELMTFNWFGNNSYSFVPKTQIEADSTQLYSTKFINPKKDFIIAGGADKNQAKIFEVSTGKVMSVIGNLMKPCLVTDSSSDSTLLAIGCADG